MGSVDERVVRRVAATVKAIFDDAWQAYLKRQPSDADRYPVEPGPMDDAAWAWEKARPVKVDGAVCRLGGDGKVLWVEVWNGAPEGWVRDESFSVRDVLGWVDEDGFWNGGIPAGPETLAEFGLPPYPPKPSATAPGS